MVRPPGLRNVTLSHHRRTLPGELFDQSFQGNGQDTPITTTDSSAVGQGASEAGSQGWEDDTPPSGDRHARPGSFLSVGMRTRWTWFREVDSPCWERCRGHKPREDVRDSTSQCRLEGERTGDGMSILEGDSKTMRGINQARNGPGKLRAGIRQGPCSKGVGGVARPEQRLLRADIL
jgi:hypothetical protein